MATLIAEDDAGGYPPLRPVSTTAEGREIAQQDRRHRVWQLERGGKPFGPAIYKFWAHGLDGCAVAAEFDPSNL